MTMASTQSVPSLNASASPHTVSPEAAILVENLEVHFAPPTVGEPPQLAVDGVSFEVSRGELLVLVGRSGCGKTTVLNVLAGLYSPTSGRARVMGKAPLDARRYVGYMFARDALLPWRTARRNVEFALEIRFPELDRKTRKERALAYMKKVGVDFAANRYPWQLSQGMRQRVALARTWAIEPDVMFMDEPFAALDAQTRGSVQDEFLAVWTQDRKTSVFVTHDLKEAILMADRILMLEKGKIIDEIIVDIPRPRRELTLEEHPRYRDIHHRLVEGLEGGRI